MRGSIATSGDTMTSITQRTHLMRGQLNAIPFLDLPLPGR